MKLTKITPLMLLTGLALFQVASSDQMCKKCNIKEGTCPSGGVADGEAICGSWETDVPQICYTKYEYRWKCGSAPNFTYRYTYNTTSIAGQSCEPGGDCY